MVGFRKAQDRAREAQLFVTADTAEKVFRTCNVLNGVTAQYQ